MAEVRRLVRETLKTRMWVGNTDDVRALVAVARELQVKSQDSVRQVLQATEPDRRRTFLSRKSLTEQEADSLWSTENERQIAEATDQIRLTMELTMQAYGEQITGPPEELLDLLDTPEQVRELRLSLGTEHPPYYAPEHSGFRIFMDKLGALTVVWGVSREWIDVAKPRLVSALKRQEPWYSWTRRGVLGGLLGYALLGVPVWVLSQYLTSLSGVGVWAGLAVALVGFSLAMVFTVFGWPKVIPQFEILRDGRQARGLQALAAAAWLGASVVIPVVLALTGIGK